MAADHLSATGTTSSSSTSRPTTTSGGGSTSFTSQQPGSSATTTTDAEQDTSTSPADAFIALGLNHWIIKQCQGLGMHRPTLIQRNCIPPIIRGEDCIGCAKTGSGKTAAFALPVLQKLCEDPYGIFALVITPTRELAFQVADQFQVLGKPIGIKAVVITGGRDMVKQGIDLSSKPHIVISTPGRLADHIDTGTNFSLKKIKFLILDEADRLLEDNFGEQLKTIFAAMPKKRQTLLFSATMSETLKELAEIAMNKPFTWFSKASTATVQQLDQRYLLMPAEVKDAYMIYVIKEFLDKNATSCLIIFTSTCKYCQILGFVCRDMELKVAVLHSMISQSQRLASLAQFKSQQVKILIATDVASRGLDIPSVDLIINHNVPNRPKDYIHRVGRTARAGRDGMAITLVTQFDVKLVHAIEGHVNTKMTEYKVKNSDVAKIVTEVAVSRREAEIRLDEQDFGERREINKRKRLILEGKDPDKELKKQEKRRKKQLKENKKKNKLKKNKLLEA